MTSMATVERFIRTTTPMPRVRPAVPEDFENIMEMCAQLHHENGAVNVDWPSVESYIIDGVNGRQSCLGVTGAPGRIEGMIYLRISRMWYSRDVILEELFNFVGAGYRRGTRNARTLCEFAKDCSDRLDCPLLIGIISNTKTEAKIRLYTRFFGVPVGGFFLYNARTGGRA